MRKVNSKLSRRFENFQKGPYLQRQIASDEHPDRVDDEGLVGGGSGAQNDHQLSNKVLIPGKEASLAKRNRSRSYRLRPMHTVRTLAN